MALRACPTWQVYPRVYGGTVASSGYDDRHLLGSIPACTGEPCPILWPKRMKAQRGLSPRVRGNPDVALAGIDLNGTGSIPACTGEPQLYATAWR